MQPQFEVAEIIRRNDSGFYDQYPVLEYHKRVLNALSNCRTSSLGGHVEACDTCGGIHVSYNSCRNRHCPKCQGAQRDNRIESRQDDVLACKYFHNVFTIPDCLNFYCLHYAKEMYDILFKSSKETLESFGKSSQYLGATTGCIGILHTWGQKLELHPHIHYIVPAGGIDKTGNWKHTRSGGKYLFPVKAMSGVFRGKFVAGFKELLQSKAIEFTAALRHAIYKQEWVVYAKRPFGGAGQVIEYLGRYTHKIAISNHRIQSIDSENVVFSYKDYSDGGKVKTMTLSSSEFLRRFCLHILPKGFRKIRHYGLLASRNKKKLRILQAKMGVVKPEREAIIYIHPDFKARRCPCCGKGEMHVIMSFGANAPPLLDILKYLDTNKLESQIS